MWYHYQDFVPLQKPRHSMISTIMTAHSYVWILVNIEQVQFLHTIIFARSTLTFFQSRCKSSTTPEMELVVIIFGFTFYSKEIINDKSWCDKHRSTRVNWLIYVHIFFMSTETSLCVSCVLAHQHAHKLSSLVKSRLHVHSQASI